MRFRVITSPTSGKPRYYDVALVKMSAAASARQAAETVRVWRGRESGEPLGAAQAEAHALRAELDASLQAFHKGT